MQIFFMRTTKTLIRLRGRAGDLSLRWAHMSEGTFSHFATHVLYIFARRQVSQHMAKPAKWHERPPKTQISLGIRPV